MDLSFIRLTIPDWFLVEAAYAADLRGTARIEVAGAIEQYQIRLRIWIDDDDVCVGEPVPKRLPQRCPERHINGNGSFCLGFDVNGLGKSLDGARVWWGLLGEYLKHQRTAEKTGLWPAHAAISHGEAGLHHVQALDAARELGVEQEYNRIFEGESCWIDDGSVRVFKDGTRLVNGRSPCPMGCKGRKARPILRRDCCKGDAVFRLVKSEKCRKSSELQFWRDWRDKGHECCRTMRKCPARDQ